MQKTALDVLLGRYSLGVKHLAAPGPSREQLDSMVQAALRAPDHRGLVPFRFCAIEGDARQRFADVLEQAALSAGKAVEGAQIDRERALRAPLTLAVVARIDLGHPLAPAHEQWMAVGGAVACLLAAAHALGFAGKMLSGAKVRLPGVVAAFCEPGETLVGWISIGTPQRAPAPHHAKAGAARALQRWEPPAG